MVLWPIIYALFRPHVQGLDNFPPEGKTIIYSNHTSLWDPVIVGAILPRQIFFMAKSELFKVPIISWIIRNLGAFPVKRGTPDLSAVKTSLQVLKNNKVFGIFPEGTRSKTGEIKSFSHGIASIAHKSKAKIVPICIQNKPRFFRPVSIKIGKPLNFDQYYSQKSSTELLCKLCDEMESAIKCLMDASEI